MMTFLAPPARCLPASAALVKMPVDSMTTSTPSSPHGMAAGSRSASTLIVWPSTVMESAVWVTSALRRPRMVSYFSRWAVVAVSPRSLTATISMSAPCSRAARKKLRPMRPKPLMPTRIVTNRSPRSVAGVPLRLRRMGCPRPPPTLPRPGVPGDTRASAVWRRRRARAAPRRPGPRAVRRHGCRRGALAPDRHAPRPVLQDRARLSRTVPGVSGARGLRTARHRRGRTHQPTGRWPTAPLRAGAQLLCPGWPRRRGPSAQPRAPGGWPGRGPVQGPGVSRPCRR